MASLRHVLAYSVEASTKITAAYQNELGRNPDNLAGNQAGLETVTPLATLRHSLAYSAEASDKITNAYLSVLGRGPDNLAGNQAGLDGGSDPAP